MEEDLDLTVVVFQSANPDFFMAHFDLLSEIERVYSTAVAPETRESGRRLVSPV
ncbi:hypothetical protein ACQP2U_32340 [Nocardia sp. CA-084685]|uniref:hypothetical protein n=1 Tax=Nocardia sp. CA-084685 TaxID=3239970 RepID=UPI003D996C56